MRKLLVILSISFVMVSCDNGEPRFQSAQASAQVKAQNGTSFHIDATAEAALAKQYGVPLPIDASATAIFEREPSAWSNKDYEVFRLNLGNNIIVIKFASYAIQRTFFLRFTYFSNMDPNKQRIEPFAYYKGMHSYNANDLGAEDLAAFFNLLQKQNMQPEAGEAKLLDMALAYGILAKKGSSYSERIGAIISFSQETEKGQRKRLLTHETMHGLFYTIPELQRDVASTIDKLPLDERKFWELFLAHKGALDGRPGLTGYNTQNHLLFNNEVFAHTMQGGLEVINEYYWNTYVPRMKKLLPDSAIFLSDLARRKPDMFTKLFKNFAALLKKHCGLENGSLF